MSLSGCNCSLQPQPQETTGVVGEQRRERQKKHQRLIVLPLNHHNIYLRIKFHSTVVALQMLSSAHTLLALFRTQSRLLKISFNMQHFSGELLETPTKGGLWIVDLQFSLENIWIMSASPTPASNQQHAYLYKELFL